MCIRDRLNTLGDLCDSVNYAMLRHGFAAVTEEETRVRVGNGVRNLVTRCIPEEKRTEAMIDNCLDDFRTAYGERMMNRTQPVSYTHLDVYKRQDERVRQSHGTHRRTLEHAD